MTRPMVRIYTAKGVYTDREMNDAEFAQYQIDNAAYLAEQTAKEEAEAQRQAILDRLGITADEAKLILK